MSKEKKQLIVPKEIISIKEFDARKKAYVEYYEKVLETKPYKKFLQAKGLMAKLSKSNWRPGDPPTEDLIALRKIGAWARNRLLEQHIDKNKPMFEDPELQQRKGLLGIQGSWDRQIKEAQDKGQDVIYQNEKSREQLSIEPDF